MINFLGPRYAGSIMKYSSDIRLGTIYRYKLLSLLDVFSGIEKTHSLLDIGGYDGFIASKVNAKSKTVIDIGAKEKFSNINYLKKDFLKHDLKKETFDHIFSFDVLEHIPEGTEEKFAKKAISLLKNKGKLYLTTPSKTIQLFPSFLTSWVSRKWGHEKCLGYTREELIKLFTSSNTELDILELDSRAYLTLYIFLRLIKKFLPDSVVERILSKIAELDAYNRGGRRGYFLVKVVKNNE